MGWREGATTAAASGIRAGPLEGQPKGIMMRNRALILAGVAVTAAASAVVLITAVHGAQATGKAGASARTGGSASIARVAAQSRAPVARSSRLDAQDWGTVNTAAGLRRIALAPHRTAYYRQFAAYMGLSGLMQLDPVRPGRCSVAVSYLYDNFLDLYHAYPGEDWTALRRDVTTEPSLSACAPRPAARRVRVQYVG